MASQNLTRTSYSDPSEQGNPTRASEVQDSEAFVDFTDYEKPLEQVHGSSLHGWGVASGLSVTATTNPPGLQVLPGVAIDSTGQHISLAVGGYAQSGTPPPTSQTTLIPPYSATPPIGMGPAGVNIPTTGLSGSMYLTIQFWETFDDNLKISSGSNVFQMDHTPWLQLVPVAGFTNNGTSLVLAEVTLDNVGNVTGVTAGSGTIVRQGPSLPLQRLRVCNYGVTTTGPAAVGTTAPEIGAVFPRPAGGLSIEANTLGIQTVAGNEVWVFNNLSSNLTCNGPLTFSLNSSVIADTGAGLQLTNGTAIVLTSPTVTFTQATTVGGTLTFNGNTTMSANLGVTGAASLTNVSVSGTLGVAGSAALASATIGGDLVISGSASVGTASITNLVVGGTASVGSLGTATINGPTRVWYTEGEQTGPNEATDAPDFSILPLPAPLTLTAFAGVVVDTSLNVSGGLSVSGNASVTGTFTKKAGQFKIDHPLDPANKYLSHSFVESPDMLNLYNGTVTTDGEGKAVVRLPAYFEPLNRDFRYQLTVIGDQFAQAIVAREILDNCFGIRTDKPRVKVSWQVTGVRQDSYANAHRIVVEEDKSEAERKAFASSQSPSSSSR